LVTKKYREKNSRTQTGILLKHTSTQKQQSPNDILELEELKNTPQHLSSTPHLSVVISVKNQPPN
jgi:hypothetical protein